MSDLLVSYNKIISPESKYKTKSLNKEQLPSALIRKLQQTKSDNDTFAICYPLNTIDSYIKYYLEIDGSKTVFNEDDTTVLFDYAVLALYTTAQNKYLLFDLDTDLLDIPEDNVASQDLAKIDSIINKYQVDSYINKHDLTNFATKYTYANGFNAHERFNMLLNFNEEENKTNEAENVTNDLLQILPC